MAAGCRQAKGAVRYRWLGGRVLTVSAMFKSAGSDQYGCDERTCTLGTGEEVPTLPLVSAIVYLDLAYRLGGWGDEFRV